MPKAMGYITYINWRYQSWPSFELLSVYANDLIRFAISERQTAKCPIWTISELCLSHSKNFISSHDAMHVILLQNPCLMHEPNRFLDSAVDGGVGWSRMLLGRHRPKTHMTRRDETNRNPDLLGHECWWTWIVIVSADDLENRPQQIPLVNEEEVPFRREFESLHCQSRIL